LKQKEIIQNMHPDQYVIKLEFINERELETPPIIWSLNNKSYQTPRSNKKPPHIILVF
jgi:hypothetical protein